jgi:hypothetical protein
MIPTSCSSSEAPPELRLPLLLLPLRLLLLDRLEPPPLLWTTKSPARKVWGQVARRL